MKTIVPILIVSTGLFTASQILLFPSSTTAQSSLSQQDTSGLLIYCGTSVDPSSKKVLPATVATVSGAREPTVLIIWKSEFFGSKFTPQQRCELVSPRFQAALHQKRNFIGAGKDERTGLGIICALSQQDEECNKSKMLFTLKSYQNAETMIETISQLDYTLQGKTNIPIYQSSYGNRVNLRDLLLLRK